MRVGAGSVLLLAASSALIALRIKHKHLRAEKARAKELIGRLPRPQVSRTESAPGPEQVVVSEGAQQNVLTRPVYDTSASVPYFKKKLARYGFGSCGPRGFLGTYTSHLLLERDLEAYFDQPALVFSSNATVVVSSVGSVGPDYCILFKGASPEVQRLKEQFRCVEIEESDFSAEKFSSPWKSSPP